MKHSTRFASLFILSSVYISQTSAALIDRGQGMIYDDVLNITWLQDANYAYSSGYASANATGSKDGPLYNIQADGKMSWQAAVQWVNNLVFGGFEDWRLPTIKPLNGSQFTYGNNAKDGSADYGYNITSTQSELAYMFNVNLGLESLFTVSDSVNTNWSLINDGIIPGTGLIQNLKSYSYWSGTQDSLLSSHSWTFNYMTGNQTETAMKNSFYAWAVRDGDISGKQTRQVSEPGALTLLGIVMLVFAAREPKTQYRKKY